MKTLFIFLLLSSALINMTMASSDTSSSQDVPFMLRFKELNLRKRIRELVDHRRHDEEMKKRVERILAYSDFSPNAWWTFSPENGECTNSQMELKEYLNFLREEKNPFTVRQDKRASYFRISVQEKTRAREEVTFWTKDRYQCEMNKTIYRSLAQIK